MISRMCAVHLPPPAALDTVTWKYSKNDTILPRQPQSAHRTPLLIHCNTRSNFRSALTDGCISHTSTAWRWCLFSQYSNSKSSAELYLLQKTVSGIKHWRCGQRHNCSGRDFSFNSMICESPELKIAACRLVASWILSALVRFLTASTWALELRPLTERASGVRDDG